MRIYNPRRFQSYGPVKDVLIMNSADVISPILPMALAIDYAKSQHGMSGMFFYDPDGKYMKSYTGKKIYDPYTLEERTHGSYVNSRHRLIVASYADYRKLRFDYANARFIVFSSNLVNEADLTAFSEVIPLKNNVEQLREILVSAISHGEYFIRYHGRDRSYINTLIDVHECVYRVTVDIEAKEMFVFETTYCAPIAYVPEFDRLGTIQEAAWAKLSSIMLRLIYDPVFHDVRDFYTDNIEDALLHCKKLPWVPEEKVIRKQKKRDEFITKIMQYVKMNDVSKYYTVLGYNNSFVAKLFNGKNYAFSIYHNSCADSVLICIEDEDNNVCYLNPEHDVAKYLSLTAFVVSHTSQCCKVPIEALLGHGPIYAAVSAPDGEVLSEVANENA